MFGACPLYPQKRTLIERVGMSALCQKRTYALQQIVGSLGYADMRGCLLLTQSGHDRPTTVTTAGSIDRGMRSASWRQRGPLPRARFPNGRESPCAAR